MAKMDPSERLFHLTCALINSKQGLTKNEIFKNVHGYLAEGKSIFDLKPKEIDALDRLFDRDKNDLRDAGIQLVGQIPSWALGDNSEYRYSIPRESMAWPSGLKLSERQVALLNLAASVWAQTSISPDATRGAMRLRALGEKPEETGLMGVAPSIRTHDRAFLPLTWAIASRNSVEFEYRKAGANSVEHRRVQPWSLQNISGQWLLVCWDEKRKAVRNFLLKRIVSPIEQLETEFDEPSQEQLDAAMADLHELISGQVASLKIKPNTEAWLHFELAKDSDGEHQIHYMDLHLLAEELREFIHDLESVRPAELKDAIDAGLQEVASAHHA